MDAITLAHGGGGHKMRSLLDEVILDVLGIEKEFSSSDSAVFELRAGRIAFTSDSFIVTPIFFPGGDIGKLAVCGTVNDLATAGAVPQYLSLSLILEEGFPLSDLRRILLSAKEWADRAGVQIVTGDTKVVDKGNCDGIYINTSGIGTIAEGVDIAPRNISPGDAIIVSGDIGRHGIAIMAARHGLEFDATFESDCAPLWTIVQKLLSESIAIAAVRDITRGGLSNILCELSVDSGAGFDIDQSSVPIGPEVRGACEILGFDPMTIACEGRMVIFVRGADAARAIEILRTVNVSENPAIIGRVTNDHPREVYMRGMLGNIILVNMSSGDLLPRIC
ncbi:MAG: hydrogenase expression/formation protein HypE [Planctomycetes bacterium]|nr:hydrogenase expression/formation protein HypE [Planctomycetota bacterium]